MTAKKSPKAVSSEPRQSPSGTSPMLNFRVSHGFNLLFQTYCEANSVNASAYLRKALEEAGKRDGWFPGA